MRRRCSSSAAVGLLFRYLRMPQAPSAIAATPPAIASVVRPDEKKFASTCFILSVSLLTCDGSFLEDFVVVLQKLFKAFIGQRMIEHHVQDLKRQSGDVRAGNGRLDHVRRRTHRARQNLRL